MIVWVMGEGRCSPSAQAHAWRISGGGRLTSINTASSGSRGVSPHRHSSLLELLLVSTGHPVGGNHWLPSGSPMGLPIFLVILEGLIHYPAPNWKRYSPWPTYLEKVFPCPPHLKKIIHLKKVLPLTNPPGKGIPLSPHLKKITHKGIPEDLFSSYLKKIIQIQVVPCLLTYGRFHLGKVLLYPLTWKRYPPEKGLPTTDPLNFLWLQKVLLPFCCIFILLALFLLFFHFGHEPYSTWRRYFLSPN